MDKNRPYAQVLEERDDVGQLLVSYVYGDDLISQDRGSASYYRYDGQLSTRQLTDTTETVTDEYIYDAFGSLISQSGATENRYLYTGEQFDPNAGFYYLRARYYDQGVGRFITTDPWMGNSFEPVTLHRYLYAGNNPVMNVDQSGEFFSLNSSMHAISISASIANSFYTGYQIGSLINRARTGANLLSTNMLGSMAEIALSIIPLHYLTKITHLSKVAVMAERLGFASVIYDTNKNIKGFNKIYHWVQRLYSRGFTPEQALEALSKGTTWVDTLSGAIAKVIGDGHLRGTIKVIIDKGKIVSVYDTKLTGKWVLK